MKSILAHCNVLMLPFIIMLAACTNLGGETSPVPTITEETPQNCAEDYKLLAMDGIVFNDGSSIRFEYSILDLNSDLIKGKESFNNLLAKFETKNFVRLSSDGTKVLQESDGQYEILDIDGNRVFELTVDYSKNYIIFSPNLQYCFLFYNNGDDGTIISTWDNTKCKAQVEYQPSFTFSDDGSSFGYIRYDESSGENSIIIHDSKSGQIIHKIPIEGNDSTTFLNQIHNNKKALYTYENDSYIIDFDGDNKTLLGHNIFFTQLSQDEKYLAYSKTYVLDLRFDISNPYIDTLESDDERGLYIKNMITGDTKFFPYMKSGNEVLQPVKWLSFSEE